MSIGKRTTRYTTLLAILLCLLCQSSFCQVYTGEEVSSLQRSLAQSHSDAELINYQLQIADILIKKPGKSDADLTLARLWINKAEKQNEQLKSIEAEGHILLEKGMLMQVNRPTQAAWNAITKAIELLKNSSDKCLLANAHRALFIYYDAENPKEVDAKTNEINQSIKLFVLCGNKLETALTLLDRADLYLSTGNFPLALKTLNESKEMLTMLHYKNLQRLYNLLGVYYFLRADYQSCLQNQFKALEICKEEKDSSSLYCEINNLIGMSFEDVDQNNQAIPYLKEALLIAKKNGDTSSTISLSINLSGTFSRLNRPQEALSVLDELTRSYSPPLRIMSIKIKIQYSYLNLLVKLHQRKKAAFYAAELLKTINQPNVNKFETVTAYSSLTRYYLSLGDYNKASACLVATRQIIDKAHIPKYKETSLHLWYILDSARGDYKGAFTNLLAYKVLEDSIFTEKKSQQIQQLQVKYETQKKDDNIKLLQQNATLDQVQIKNARLIRNVTLGAITVFLLIIGMQYRRYREKQKLNLVVTNQNVTLQKLVTEKEWLLKEVHHRVKNNLHTIMCLLESQAMYLESDALKAIENSRHRIYAMSLIHQKLYQSDDIKTVDMGAYLTEFVSYLRESFGSPDHVRMLLHTDAIKLNATQAIPIGLIVNEAVNNSFKYAFPAQKKGEIKVELKRIADEIHLSISDNGIGFKQHADQALNSLGLELIKGLTLDLRGTVSFNTDNGTIIQIRFIIDQVSILEGGLSFM